MTCNDVLSVVQCVICTEKMGKIKTKWKSIYKTFAECLFRVWGYKSSKKGTCI